MVRIRIAAALASGKAELFIYAGRDGLPVRVLTSYDSSALQLLRTGKMARLDTNSYAVNLGCAGYQRDLRRCLFEVETHLLQPQIKTWALDNQIAAEFLTRDDETPAYSSEDETHQTYAKMSAPADVHWLPANLWGLLSYLPIALYAESLIVSSALILAISNQTIVPTPTTGCVKDIQRLWNLSRQELLSGFDGRGPIVASRRHGNTFPLVNKAVLEEARLIGRSSDDADADSAAHRPTTVHVTFVTLRTGSPGSKRIHLARMILSLEISMLILFSVLLIRKNIVIGALLVNCVTANLFLLWLIQHFTSFIYANSHALASDLKRTAAHGAATDVHVIVQHWNASEMDVLIGYSSQLHALTNIPVRIKRWKVVKWTARAIIVVLTTQAALLGSLVGRSGRQALGSAVWLLCYLVLQIPPRVLAYLNPDAVLDGQPAAVKRLTPLTFSGRRPALAFIASLPMTDSRSGPWEWLEGFMPRNERRRQWETEMVAAGVPEAAVDGELGSQIEHSTARLLREINSVKKNEAFKAAAENFIKQVQLRQNACP